MSKISNQAYIHLLWEESTKFSYLKFLINAIKNVFKKKKGIDLSFS